MSLTVHVYRRSADGEMDFIDGDDPGSEIAEFESCRSKLWGHASVQALGVCILPFLIDNDVYVEGEEILQLEADVRQILAHLSDVSAKTGFAEDFINSRCENILKAARRAHGMGGGVVIW